MRIGVASLGNNRTAVPNVTDGKRALGLRVDVALTSVNPSLGTSEVKPTTLQKQGLRSIDHGSWRPRLCARVARLVACLARCRGREAYMARAILAMRPSHPFQGFGCGGPLGTRWASHGSSELPRRAPARAE